MAVSSVESLTNKDTNKTWKEEFDSVRKGTQEYDKLRTKFKEFVADHEAFSKSMEREFDDFLKNLDDISKSWDSINDKVSDLDESFDTLGVTAEDIRRVFSDIAATTTTVAQQLSIQRSTVLKIQNLTGDLSRVYSVEGQFQQKNLDRLVQRAGMLKDEYEFRAKILTGGSLEESALQKANDLHTKKLRTLESQLKVARNNGTSRAELAELQRKIDLEKSNLEYLAKGNLQYVQRLELLAKSNKEIRKGVVKDNRGVQTVAGVTSKLAGFLGLSDVQDQIKDIKENFLQTAGANRFTVKIAGENLEKSERNKKFADKDLTKQVADAKKYDPKIEEKVKKYRGLSENIEKRKLKNAEVGRDDSTDSVLKKLESLRNSIFLTNSLTQSIRASIKADKELVDNQEDYNTALKASNQEHKLGIQACKEMLATLKGSITSVWMLAALVGKALWSSFTAVDESAVKLQRAVGTWEGDVAGANAKLATSKDYLEQTYTIAKKFGINTSAVFTPAELARAAEFKNLSNLSADQVATLAVRAKVVGKNIDEYNKGLNAGWKNIVSSTSAAVNFEAVQEEVANISAALAISLGGNPEKIAEAATAARSLGMSLKDMESIADNLLNFESSIKSEMEAQLLTGMSLNLAGARECALYNDMTGLAEQLNGQGLTFERLAGMNRIQLNSVAQALGMSKDQLAEMVQQQVLSSNMSDKQKAAMLRMSEEDFRRMTTEKQWQQTKEKFLQSLVPLMKPIVDILTMIIGVARPITALIGKAVSYIGYIIDPLQKAFSTIQEFWGKLFSGSGKSKKDIQEVGDQVQDLSANVQKAGFSPLAALLAFSVGVKGLSVAFKGTIASVKLFAKAAKAAFVAPFKGIGKLIGGINKLSAAYSALQSKILKTRAISGGSKAGATGKVLAGGFWKSIKGSAKGAFVEGKGGSKAASSVVESVSGTKAGGDVSKKLSGTSKGVKGFSGKNVLAGAAAMVLVAGSLFILAHALKAMNGVGLKECGLLAGGLAALAGVVFLLGKMQGDLMTGAAAMLLMGIALLPLAFSLKLLIGVDWKQFAIMAASIAVFALEMTVLGALLAGPQALLFLAGAAAVGVMSVALMAFAATMAVLSKTQGIEVNTEKVSEQIESLVPVASSLAKLGLWMLPVIPAALLVIAGSGAMLLALSSISAILRIASKLPVVDTTNLVAMTKGMLSITKNLGLTAAILALTVVPLLALPALIRIVKPALTAISTTLKLASKLPVVDTTNLVAMTKGMLSITKNLGLTAAILTLTAIPLRILPARIRIVKSALRSINEVLTVANNLPLPEVQTEKFAKMTTGMLAVTSGLVRLGVWMFPVIPAALLTIAGSGVMLLALRTLNKALTVANSLPGVQTEKFAKMTASMLAITARLARLGGVLLIYSAAILSTTATLLTVRAALKSVSKTLDTANGLPSVDLSRVKSSISDLIEISKGLASVRPVNFTKFWSLKRSLSIISGFKDMKLASGIDQVTDALSRFSEILNRLDVEKFNKLSVRRIKAIAKVQTQQQPEGVQESYKATVQTRAVADSRKQSRVESVEKGKVDLSVIEQKLDVVVKAIESSRPDWNWLEFDKAAATGLPGWQRNR